MLLKYNKIASHQFDHWGRYQIDQKQSPIINIIYKHDVKYIWKLKILLICSLNM